MAHAITDSRKLAQEGRKRLQDLAVLLGQVRVALIEGVAARREFLSHELYEAWTAFEKSGNPFDALDAALDERDELLKDPDTRAWKQLKDENLAMRRLQAENERLRAAIVSIPDLMINSSESDAAQLEQIDLICDTVLNETAAARMAALKENHGKQ